VKLQHRDSYNIHATKNLFTSVDVVAVLAEISQFNGIGQSGLGGLAIR
jgi:hypothetical protein